MRRKGKSKTAYIIILVFSLVLTVFLIVYSNTLGNIFNKTGILNIKAVDVILNKIDCATADQIKNSADLLGQNILLIDSNKIENRIKNKFLCVKNVLLTPHFPNKISISVLVREPRALVLLIDKNEATDSAQLEQIATPSANIKDVKSTFLVDETGDAFAKDKIVDADKIFYQEDDLVLGKISDKLVNALRILEKIKSYGLNFSVSEIMDGIFLVFPKDSGPKIVFRLTDNLDVKLASLQLIIGQAKMNEKELEFIDLRFDNPIVKIAPKRKNG